MSKIKNMKLRYKVGFGVATTAAVVGLGGAAFGVWSSTGSGSGSASTGSSHAWTLTQTTTLSPLAPGVAAQTIKGTVTNTAGYTEYIGTVTPSVSSVAETTGEMNLWGDPNSATDGLGIPASGSQGTYYCSASDYTVASNAVNTDEVSGATNVVFGTIAFKDIASPTIQDACQGASVSLSFSSN